MNSKHIEQQIDEIEAAIVRDDPALANRFRLLDQRDARRDRIVFSLLSASMVLLGYGLATQAAVAWLAGGAAFVTSFVIDGHFERRGELERLRKEGASR